MKLNKDDHEEYKSVKGIINSKEYIRILVSR